MKEEGAGKPPVPEGYFRELPNEVLRRIRAEEGLRCEEMPEAATGRRGWLWYDLLAARPGRFAAGLAAALLLALAGAYFLWPGEEPKERPGTLTSVSQEEAAEYVARHIEEFGLGLMVEASVVNAEDTRQLEMLPEIQEEELDEYLDGIIDEIGLEELEELL